jgi:hypothetical protein
VATTRALTPAVLALLTEGGPGDEHLDLLQHSALANAIVDAILGTPSEDPLGIALYGSWGVGKSTIGTLVGAELARRDTAGRTAFVRVETWKYAVAGDRQPLRRHYLLAAYRAIGLDSAADALQKQFTHVVTTQELAPELSAREVAKATAQWLRRWLKTWRGQRAALLFLTPLAFLAFPQLRHLIGSFYASVVTTLALVSAVLLTLINAFIRIAAGRLTFQSQADPFSSVEEFDRQFDVFLETDAVSYDRFVFFIDDLDRCGDDTVVEALETIRAFFGRSRCVFIVGADERQLKRAIRAKSVGPAPAVAADMRIPPDESFLEKIFQVSVYVPPLFAENLHSYADALAQKTRLGSLDTKMREAIISYLVHPEVTSPRQVKVILNDFLLTLEQAEAREDLGDTNLVGSPLSADLMFTAKMVVLREHFPWYYELLRADPRLLITWADADKIGTGPQATAELARAVDVVRKAAEQAASQATIYASEPRLSSNVSLPADLLLAALRGYLRRTADTRPDDADRVLEFIYLRGRAIFAGLIGPGASAMRIAIANGDGVSVGEVLAQHPELGLPAARLAIERTKTGFGVERALAAEPLATIVSALSDADLNEIGEEAAVALFERSGDSDE